MRSVWETLAVTLFLAELGDFRLLGVIHSPYFTIDLAPSLLRFCVVQCITWHRSSTTRNTSPKVWWNNIVLSAANLSI
ncbi:hypothetical protein F5148DRAFT_1185762 [Russula earlei]|uniref:Uncharacterized protein n=1 Tax=Russula earlei TaxID=71964 RepID=A0ACC0UF48_9AGAM|nr:hypothetical protein F5148DRAFT_1185762 [Russula earlei]